MFPLAAYGIDMKKSGIVGNKASNSLQQWINTSLFMVLHYSEYMGNIVIFCITVEGGGHINNPSYFSKS